MVMKSWDKKDICLLSTIHNSEQGDTKKKDKDGNTIKKPKLVLDYNDTMGGVDRMDQLLHDYPTTRKRGKKYYKGIFFHLLDISIWNAFILYQKKWRTKGSFRFLQDSGREADWKASFQQCLKREDDLAYILDPCD